MYRKFVQSFTASGTTAEQELLLSSDSPPWCKVCKCQLLCVSVGVLNCIDNCQAMLTMNPYPNIYIYIYIYIYNICFNEQRKNRPPDTGNC